ncbi:hypothetical protein ACEZCY_28360 [Streptacidiphilus sp. N1-12]|uniref:DUF3806 domain-containing protein n=2 Tax=Streptacidiphilus alkalitolerans TaxID=3342712 RepID=A0ABV6WMB4_9ACTN
MSPESVSLEFIAAECVALVATEFDRHLDWSVESLAELDAVCGELLADGPLGEARLNLWWKLIGAYTGEVVVRVYGGQWITHDSAPGAPAVSVLGLTGFPFGIAHRVLNGEDFKSLASFGRSLPAIAEHSARSE